MRARTNDELLSQEKYTFEVKAFEKVEASAGATNEKSCQIIVNVESDNANAPEFKNCPNGEASMNIDEGSAVGTVIGSVSLLLLSHFHTAMFFLLTSNAEIPACYL